MSRMVIKLDPEIPLVWRTPHSLQFGVDRPCVFLEDVSNADERIIAALVTGTSQSGIDMIAKCADLGIDELAHLLDALRPAMKPSPTPMLPIAGRTVSISGTGPTVNAITALLTRSAISVEPDVVALEPPAETDLAIIVSHFVVHPALHARWLNRDIPHLAVVFGDRFVRIGPLVTPGVSACLICLELHARDADSAHAALSSQLWGRTSAAETALVSAEVAAICSRIVVNFGGPANSPPEAVPEAVREAKPRTILSVTTRSIQLDILTGSRLERVHRPHPHCGCLSIDRL